MFYVYLGRVNDVFGWMKREFYFVDGCCFFKLNGGEVDVVKLVLYNWCCSFGIKVMLMFLVGVIGVFMSDQCFIDWVLGIDVNICGWVVDVFIGKFEQCYSEVGLQFYNIIIVQEF